MRQNSLSVEPLTRIMALMGDIVSCNGTTSRNYSQRVIYDCILCWKICGTTRNNTSKLLHFSWNIFCKRDICQAFVKHLLFICPIKCLCVICIVMIKLIMGVWIPTWELWRHDDITISALQFLLVGNQSVNSKWCRAMVVSLMLTWICLRTKLVWLVKWDAWKFMWRHLNAPQLTDLPYICIACLPYTCFL